MAEQDKPVRQLKPKGYQYGYSTPNPLPCKDLVGDFRSDTVTRVERAMKEAMLDCENYGDDVYDEDMTVKELERRVAELCGKEKALFCPTGTMTNQLALRAQLGALQSLICDSRAHIYSYEAGGVAYHCQAQVRPITPALQEGHRSITREEIQSALFFEDVHRSVSAGVALENTLHGTIISLEDIREIRQLCDEAGMFLHLDGARLANACVASGHTLREYAEPFDTISLCLSKSLACPIGSMLVGSEKVIQRAKHFRKLFGGGWRQAGILAAAGLYALDHHWDRLEEDHANAQYLREQFESMGFEIECPTETNQVWVSSERLGVTFDDLAAECRKKGLLLPGGEFHSRVVTHIQTNRETCTLLVDTIREFLRDRKVIE